MATFFDFSLLNPLSWMTNSRIDWENNWVMGGLRTFSLATSAMVLVVALSFPVDSLQAQSKGGFYFNNGGSRSSIPQFGGYDPGAAARTGFQYRGNGSRMGFGLTMGQGSTRSNTMSSTSVVLPNGGTGQFFSGTVNTFVTGVTPVVGSRGGWCGTVDPWMNLPPYGRYPGGRYPPNWRGPGWGGPGYWCGVDPGFNRPPRGCGPRFYGCCGCYGYCRCNNWGNSFYRPVGYGIQTAPFAAPGSVWLGSSPNNFGNPFAMNGARVSVPRVSRLSSLIQQNGGPNKALRLTGANVAPAKPSKPADLRNIVTRASKNSTADKPVKSLAQIRKEMAQRKKVEADERSKEILRLIERSEKLRQAGKSQLAMKYARRADGRLKPSEVKLKQRVEKLILDLKSNQ